MKKTNKKILESWLSFKKSDLENNDYRVRVLTPRECWRLMGVKEDDIDKVFDKIKSKTQLYALAGNSIITNCMTDIYDNLLSAYKKEDTNNVETEQLPNTGRKRKVLLGYSRDGKGHIVNHHEITASNTLTTVTGSCWSTDIYIVEFKDKK